MKLSEFKDSYDLLAKKYSLPDFDEMNSIFDIGKIKRDSGNLVRDIRQIMGEKTSYFMRLLEVMVNPSQAPPTFLMLIKEMTSEDKKLIDSSFSSLMDLELEAYRLNISSTEKEEAEFILKIYNTWKGKVADLNNVVGILERNWNKVTKVQKQNKGYFN